MQRTINRNLLKYAAGSGIFCPLCETCMDATRTVLLTAGKVTKTVCCSCYDRELKPAIERRPGLLERCEVIDGRVEFGRPSRKTTKG